MAELDRSLQYAWYEIHITEIQFMGFMDLCTAPLVERIWLIYLVNFNINYDTVDTIQERLQNRKLPVVQCQYGDQHNKQWHFTKLVQVGAVSIKDRCNH